MKKLCHAVIYKLVDKRQMLNKIENSKTAVDLISAHEQQLRNTKLLSRPYMVIDESSSFYLQVDMR